MKILQLCKKFPYPINDGESIAVINLSKGLSQVGVDISLFAFNTTKDPYLGDLSEKALGHYVKIYTIDLNNELRAAEALLCLIKNKSYHIDRFNTKEARLALSEVLQKNTFDIILMESIFMAPYLGLIRSITNCKIILRAHNVEYKIWERISAKSKWGLKNAYLKILTKQLKVYEKNALNKFDLVAAMSVNDLAIFKEMGLAQKAIKLGIGLDLAHYENIKSQKNHNSICFIGSLDWIPNLEGLVWFLEEVWPLVNQKYPDLEFHIAGKNTPDSIYSKQGKNIVVHGQVENAVTFIKSHSTLIVPLFSGSGLRVKILEAMACNTLVMSSTIGAD